MPETNSNISLKIIFNLGILLGCLLGLNIVGLLDYYDRPESCPIINYTYNPEQLERYEMYSDNLKNKSDYVNGLFRYGKDYAFYSVWVMNRSLEDIETTHEHEVCHALVYVDYEHFCNHNNTSVMYREYEKK